MRGAIIIIRTCIHIVQSNLSRGIVAVCVYMHVSSGRATEKPDLHTYRRSDTTLEEEQKWSSERVNREGGEERALATLCGRLRFADITIGATSSVGPHTHTKPRRRSISSSTLPLTTAATTAVVLLLLDTAHLLTISPFPH